MQLTERVHSIPVAVKDFSMPLAPVAYLVVDGGEAAFIDSGLGEEEMVQQRLDYLASLGDVKVKYVILTHHHFDHSGGADAFRQATGAQVVMHREEEAFVRDPRPEAPQDVEVPREQRERAKVWREAGLKAIPDRVLDDGETLSVGSATIEAVHTPGHTKGSLCLYLREEKVLFTGDTILGLGTVAIAPPPWGDMVQYMQSLRKLLNYDIALLLPGHGPSVKEGRRKIEELIQHRAERDRQILASLRRGRRTPKEILPDIYPELDKRLVGMATGQIASHLYKLEVEGKVTKREEAGETIYAPA